MPKLSPYHRDLSYSYAPGVYPSQALLDARPGCARRLLLHSAASSGNGVATLRALCASLGVREETADHALARISKKENCYAAIVFEKFEDGLDAARPHIVLHNPSDMGNLGTILRTCLGFGFLDLAIVRPAADHFDPRVVRASMGALFAMRVHAYDTLDAYRAEHPGHMLYPFMLDSSTPLEKVVSDPKKPFALVFGNEGSGLPPSFAALGTAVRIPHSGRIDSLNLAVAVSIAAYAFSPFAQEP